MVLNKFPILVLVFILGMASLIPFFPQTVPDFNFSMSRDYDHENDVGSIRDSEHAVRNHHEEAVMARTCLSDPNKHLFFNDITKRTGIVCLLPDGHWGIVIMDELGREITAFIKNKMKRFDQVVKYMSNCHYCLKP